jgi:hypothetical protein
VTSVADVFISYGSKDRDIARKVAHAIAARGQSVWWDRAIIAGESFDEAIERELDCARAVVVLWTRDSVASEWVKNEATSAAGRGVLVPARIDVEKLPLEFRRRQTADLTGWDGDTTHEGFQSLCRGIDKLVGKGAPEPPSTAPDARAPAGKRANLLIGALVLLVVVAGAFFLMAGLGDEPPTEAVMPARDTPLHQDAPAPKPAESDLAALIAGTYSGDVVSDSLGSSRRGITVTVMQLGTNKVRVTSPYERIGTVEIEVHRIGSQVFNTGGDSVLIVELGKNPPTLSLTPRGELAFNGVRL